MSSDKPDVDQAALDRIGNNPAPVKVATVAEARQRKAELTAKVQAALKDGK